MYHPPVNVSIIRIQCTPMASNLGLKNAAYEFVDTVPKKLTCSICITVLSDPRLTECCGQHFCQECLQSWLRKQWPWSKTCPHCREKDFVHILDKPVQREINQLKVRCSHHEEGCEWVGELGDLQTHLDSQTGCGYVEVECPNNYVGTVTTARLLSKGRHVSFNKHVVYRRDLEEHLRDECDQRRYECQYCGEEDKYAIVLLHHGECPNFPLDCPNECGVTEMKRKDLPAHREQCPLEPVPCPFQEAGCETGPIRKDLEEHLTSHSQQHLLLTFRRTCSQEQEYTQLKKRCKKLEKKNSELEQRLKRDREFKVAVNERKKRIPLGKKRDRQEDCY